MAHSCSVVKPNHDLPEDILSDVLARLPVKSLIRFRCVCKPWRALISDPGFVMKQFSYAAAKVSGESDLRLMFSLNRPDSIYCLEALNDLKAPPLDITVRCTPFGRTRIVGSCNGLMCLEVKCDSGQFILWNPCTGDYNVLPLPPSPYCSFFHGFGYDSTTDDYKVIRGLNGYRVIRGTCRPIKSMIEVFSLKSGSWRTHDNSKNVCIRGNGCLLAGVLHWIQFRTLHDFVGSTVVSFDLAKEKFREDMSSYPAFGVLTIRNCLSVISWQSSSPLGVTIFMMKEYGVKESWTEVVKLPIDAPISRARPTFFSDITWLQSRPTFCSDITYLKPLCILENDEVLVPKALNRVHLELYNPKEKEYREVHVFETNEDYHDFEATLYRESLISPLNSRQWFKRMTPTKR